MVRFFLVWKSLNISFDEPIPPFLNSYDFFFLRPVYSIITLKTNLHINYIPYVCI